MKINRLKTIFLWILLIIVIAIFFFITNRKDKGTITDNKSSLNATLIDDLSRSNIAGLDPLRLDDDLLPTTNKWYSSILYSDEGLAVFPMPHSIKFQPNGMSYSIPTVTTNKDVITAPHEDVVSLISDEIQDYKVTYYDDLVIKVATIDQDNNTLGTFTIAQGVPYITYTILVPHLLNIEGLNNFTLIGNDLNMTYRSTNYTVKSNAGQLSSSKLYEKDDMLSLFGSPADQDASSIAAQALSTIESTAVTYDLSASENNTTTTYGFKTATGAETVFATLPHHQIDANDSASVVYNTLYGNSVTQVGSQFKSTIDTVDFNYRLPLNSLSEENKNILKTQLENDIASTEFKAVDTYFSAKELYRAAQLYDIASQLKLEDQADVILFKLNAVFDDWLDNRSIEGDRGLYYDTTLRGIIGENPSFGSELYNDHHFHYGYMIYAAALVATHNQEFVTKNKDFIDLLVADIASKDNNEYFPKLRVYDPYIGHSWASGNGAFNDGNNQESSSEAINAWVGVKAWSLVTNQIEMQNLATWLLANESNTAQMYWTNIDTSKDIYSGYDHEIVSINWSGKRDYATFFSAEPSAIFGIQLLPMNPYMQSHFKNEVNTQSKIYKALGDAGYDQPFGDSLLLYSSLTQDLNISELYKIIEKLAPENVDGALSKAYLYSWVSSL